MPANRKARRPATHRISIIVGGAYFSLAAASLTMGATLIIRLMVAATSSRDWGAVDCAFAKVENCGRGDGPRPAAGFLSALPGLMRGGTGDSQ